MLLFEPLLPPKPSVSAATAAAATSFPARRPLFQAPDLLSLKKRGQGARSLIRVDAATGQSQVFEVDKFSGAAISLRATSGSSILSLFTPPLCCSHYRSKMESDEGNNGFEIDSSLGTLVWVRRRNGSWWPGRVLGIDELPEICLNMPKSGTPIKLLGKEDGSVDLLDIEALEVALRSGKLQAHSVETGIAIITDGGVTLKIDTKLLTNLSLRIDSIYQFIGELQIQSENDAILQARVGRNIDGIDLNLYYQTMKLCRKLEEEIGRSRTK